MGEKMREFDDLEMDIAKDEANSWSRDLFLENMKEKYPEDWDRAYEYFNNKYEAESLFIEWMIDIGEC